MSQYKKCHQLRELVAISNMKKVETVKKNKNCDKDKTYTEKDVLYYVECSFENTLLELNSRLGRGESMIDYTLGKHGNKFIVVNDGGNHGNIVFRQAITILSTGGCTAGKVIITVRILEHENYELFENIIHSVLVSGISRLQETAFYYIAW